MKLNNNSRLPYMTRGRSDKTRNWLFKGNGSRTQTRCVLISSIETRTRITQRGGESNGQRKIPSNMARIGNEWFQVVRWQVNGRHNSKQCGTAEYLTVILPSRKPPLILNIEYNWTLSRKRKKLRAILHILYI